MAYKDIKDKGFDSRTTEEQQEIARKGGIASGEARRKKKQLEEAALKFADIPVMNIKMQELMETFGIKEEDYSYPMLFVANLWKAFYKENMKAGQMLKELMGEDFNNNYRLEQLELEKAKLELEIAKLEQQVQETTQSEADNSFIDALNNKASELWNETENTDITAEHSESEESGQDQ